MKLLIIRHGDPDYVNDSLTPKGRREAELLSERLSGLGISSFYCSPLGRAQATAEPTLRRYGAEARTMDWLEEFSGYITDPETGEKRIPWDLMPSCWTRVPDYYDRSKWLKTELFQSGNVEKRYGEVCRGLDSLLESCGYVREGSLYRVERENRETVALFCHFGVECVLLSHLIGVSPLVLWQGFVALPSSVTTMITEEREKGVACFRCNGFGDLSHLYSAGEPASFAARFCETFSDENERH